MAAASTTNASANASNLGPNANNAGGAGKRPINNRWNNPGPHPFAAANANANSAQGGGRAGSSVNSNGPAASSSGPGQQRSYNSAAGSAAAAPAAAGGPGQTNSVASQQQPVNNHTSGTSTANAIPNIVASAEESSRMHDRMLYLLVNLIGTRVTATLRSGQKYTGILSSTNDIDLSIVLRVVRLVNRDPPSSSAAPNPPKPTFLIPAREIVDIETEAVSFELPPAPFNASRPTSPGVAGANTQEGGQSDAFRSIMSALGQPVGDRDTFRTDADISGGLRGENRTLQKWGGGTGNDNQGIGGLEDSLEGTTMGGSDSTFNSSGKGWDQFAVNEKLFGAKTNYQEELYTTKLDKSGADFKAREKRAIQLANEIQNQTISGNNAHLAEERGLSVDDSGLDEEDKYSGVLRGKGAYIPPAARKGMASDAGKLAAPAGPKAATPPAATSHQEVKANGSLPQARRGSDQPSSDPSAAAGVGPSEQTPAVAAATPASATTAPTSTAVAPTAAPAVSTPSSQNPEALVGQFRKFVIDEREKLVQKKQALVKQDKDNKIAELVKFSKSFVLKTPIPQDLVPMLTKDEIKQKELAARQAAASSATAAATVATPSTSTTKPASTNVSPNVTNAATPKLAAAGAPASGAKPASAAVPIKKVSPYALAPIPPFDPVKAAAARAAKAAQASGTPVSGAAHDATATAAASKPSAPATTTKFNAAAPAFVFRPTANTFTPGGPAAPSATPAAVASAGPSPAKKAADLPTTISAPVPVQPIPVNPFFGTKIPRPSKNLLVKEDFSPFKHGAKTVDATTVSPSWGYTGRPFRSLPQIAAIPGPSPIPAPASIASHPSSRLMSPQLAQNVPPHLLAQQQSMQGPHVHNRNLRVLSPSIAGAVPPHLSRSPSNQGPTGVAGGTDESKQSSQTTTPAPSAANTPQTGNMQHAPQLMHQGPQPGLQHVVPQGYAVYQPQHFPGGPQYRFAAGGAGINPGLGQTAGPPQHPGQPHMQQYQIPPNAYPPQGFVAQMPFSPPIHGGSQPIYSPQLGGPMAPGQFMSPMFVAQPGQRGQGPQVAGGPPSHVFYPQMQGGQGMPQQFAMAMPPQGMPMAAPPPMFDQAQQQ